MNKEVNSQNRLGLFDELDSRIPTERADAEFTFRDPSGSLRLTELCALRRIHPAAVEETLAFLASSLRKSLERNGDLISTEVVKPREFDAADSEDLWLQHPRIDPISYPWEWTTSQWKAAAELTLRLADEAIGAGWMLKDATPLNIVFDGPRPVLVDVLSFERRDPRSSVWLAYGQFVRTFLLPLIAEKFLCWPLRATLFARDGYEPSELYRALSPWQRLKPDLLDVITLATIFENKSGNRQKPAAVPARTYRTDPELAAHILHKRIARLRKQIHRSARTEKQSAWSGYSQTATHYKAADNEGKKQFVKSVLERCFPGRVLDIGANTGTYSLLAASAGAEVVSLDSDSTAIDELWQKASRDGTTITALVANIARPTPPAGWLNREQLSLLERLNGKFDLVLMLAVIHHLILREQLPLSHIGRLCASLTRRWLVLEWVPPSDPMFQEWLRGREHLYGELTEDDLRQAFEPYFEVADRMVLGNNRILLLFERTRDGMYRSGATTE